MPRPEWRERWQAMIRMLRENDFAARPVP